MKFITAKNTTAILTALTTTLLLSACSLEEEAKRFADQVTGEAVDYEPSLNEITSNPATPDRVLPPNPAGCPDWKKDQTVNITESMTLPAGCKYDRVSILISNQSNLTFDCNGAVFNGLDREYRQAVGMTYSTENAPVLVGIQVQSSENTQSRNVTIKNCTLTNYVRGIRVNFGISTASRSDLKNNINVSALEEHLRTLSPKNIKVENCKILSSHKDGLFIGRFVTDFVLERSEIKYTGAVGLYLDSGSQRNIIKNSTISENGHSDYSITKRERRKKLENDSREGIAIDSSAHNTIENNVFSKNARGSILIYKNCNEHALDPNQVPRYQSADSNLIQNNKFINEDIGVWVASRQSKNLNDLDCGIPVVHTGTVHYAGGAVREDARYYQDYAKHNEIKNNRFSNAKHGIIVEDDDTSVIENTFTGSGLIVDVRVGTPYRMFKLNHPVTDTKIENNTFNSSTRNHIELLTIKNQSDEIVNSHANTRIKNNTPANVNN